MLNPDEYQDELFILYDSNVKEINEDEFEELQNEYADLFEAA